MLMVVMTHTKDDIMCAGCRNGLRVVFAYPLPCDCGGLIHSSTKGGVVEVVCDKQGARCEARSDGPSGEPASGPTADGSHGEGHPR